MQHCNGLGYAVLIRFTCFPRATIVLSSYLSLYAGSETYLCFDPNACAFHPARTFFVRLLSDSRLRILKTLLWAVTKCLVQGPCLDVPVCRTCSFFIHPAHF